MPSQALIEFRDVDIAQGSAQLVRRLSFDVAPGRVLAVVSERRAVREALAAVLAGSIDEYRLAGDLVMEGRELVARVTSQRATPAETHVARIAGPLDTRAHVRELAEAETLALVGLAELGGRRVHDLALADRVRAAFAVALTKRPRLIVLELPLTADAGAPYPVYTELIRTISRPGELALVICTDSLAVAADIADDVLVTLNGRGVEYGSVYDVCLRPRMPYVEELLRVTPSPHRVLPDFSSFVDMAAREGCPWVLNCRAGVVHACSHEQPGLRRVAPGHAAACHLLGDAHGD